jgi:RimJ/RimL family protein N-acetyltransferase
MRYIPEGVFSETQAQEFISKNRGEDTEAYAVILKAEGKLIGHMVFHPWFAPQTYEIGWVFHKAYHGQGYASEAAFALLQYGFEVMKLHRIIATCQPENTPSWRVMEKIGLRREGLFRKCIYRGDNYWWDEYFYALLEEEWFKGVDHNSAGNLSRANE